MTFKRFMLCLALVLCQSRSVLAINNPAYVAPTALTAPGNIGPINVVSNNLASALIVATGTGAGLSFTGQCVGPDNTTWKTVQVVDPGTVTASTTLTANGSWFVPIAGCSQFRINLASISSGTETFSINGSVAQMFFPGASGGGGGGTVTQGTAAAAAGAWPVYPTAGSAALSVTNGLYTNLLQGNAVLSTGNPLFGQLTAGSAIIGKVGIDQTTPGTTNAVATTNFPSSVSTGTGAQGASSPRVTVATDSATVAGSASIPAGTNLIGKTGIDQTTPGTTNAVATTNFPSSVSTGTGAQGASSPRVTVATDSATVAGSATLPAGTNLIGKTGIDQTTPGTTNAVSTTNFPSAVSTGTGAQGASSPRVTVATDSATVAGSATIPAGTNLMGKVGIDQTTGGTTNAVTSVTTTSANVSPTLYNSAAVESGHIIKASAGNMYRAYVFSTAAGLLMVFNSTTIPADGAVTPVECVPVNANSSGWVDNGIYPDNYGTGISVALSSGTNCFSKTAISNGFFKVDYK